MTLPFRSGVRARRAIQLLGALGALFVFAGTFGGCGGGAAAETRSEHDAANESSSAPRERAKPAAPDASEEDESEAPSAVPTCDGETCFSCGKGLCPLGWYCDEGARGGPACGWVPECATKATCGCLGKALGHDCSCTEESNAAHVSCK